MKMSEPSYSLPVPVDVITQRDPHPHHRHRHHRHNRHHRHPHHRLRSSSLRVGRLFAAHPRRSPRVIGHRHRSSRTNTHAATHLDTYRRRRRRRSRKRETRGRYPGPPLVVSSPCCPLRVPPPPPTETRGFGNDDGWMDRFSLLLGEGGEEEEEKWDDSSRMLSTPRSLATLLGSWIRSSSSPRISRRPPLIRPQAHTLRHRGRRFALLVS